MDTKKLIIGNWKMNPSTLKSAKENFLAIKKGLTPYKKTDVAIAPPYLYVPEFSKLINTSISLGAQNISAEWEGAFTGEISGQMLASFNTRYVIIGHSERRAMGEMNSFINKKIKIAIKAGITPVLCIGETDRENGMWHFGKIKVQIEECLAGISKNVATSIIIAYEPVWAISTTVNSQPAKPSDCEEMVIYIQKILVDMFGIAMAQKIKILYGGSVDEKNAEGFLREGRADGLLIGKTSLNPKKFLEIIKIANNC